jgi:hypothetical protein
VYYSPAQLILHFIALIFGEGQTFKVFKPYKTEQVIVLSILIFMFLHRRREDKNPGLNDSKYLITSYLCFSQ